MSVPCPRTLALAYLLLLAAPASAQEFTGTFTVPNELGGTMVLSLVESGASVSGTLSSNGVTYQVTGRIEDETLVGTMTGAEGAMHFAAERWEDELWVEIYGTDANGQPDYDDFAEIDFVLADAGGLAGGTTAPARASAAPAPPSAAPAPASAAPAAPTAPAPPTADVAGGGAAGRTATGRPLAPGFTEDHPQVREWVSFLSGKKLTQMSSYSSGSAGGYSARTDLYLCSDRSFALRDESSVSVDVGGAFGNSGGVDSSQGRWYVITNGQVVGLVLEAASGEASEFRMDYANGETYANGERVYVTPVEVCMQ